MFSKNFFNGESMIGHIIMVPLVILIYCLIFKCISVFFGNLQKNGRRLHLRFLENVLKVVVFLFALLWLLSGAEGLSRVFNLVFGSTVVITGIVGLAGQDILKDVLAGVILSASKPFEIGDRVLLSEVEKACTIEDMTLRHVVLKTMDGVRYIIPNSEINNKIIANTSYKQKLRGSFICIPIAYTADVRKAVEIVREVVRQCPYTFPNNSSNEDLGGYGEVYVMSYQDCALNLETTIWTEPSMDNFLACSEIRMRILEAFRENDIEIPYYYTNVIMREDIPRTDYITPVSRNITVKMDPIEISDYRSGLIDATKKVGEFCEFHNIERVQGSKIVLISEELLSFSHKILGRARLQFWIEGNQDRVRLQVRTVGQMNRKKQRLLIKNTSDLPAFKQFAANLSISIANGIEPTEWLFETQETDGHDEYEKQILLAFADAVKMGIIDRHFVISVEKSLKKK